MTKAVYQSMFVLLGMLLMAALFVMQPTNQPELAKFQSDVKSKLVTATQQVFGSQDYSEPFALIWATTENFYNGATDEAIALLQPDEAFMSLALSFDADYNAAVASNPTVLALVPRNEAPLYGIVPTGNPEALIEPSFNDDAAYYHSEFGGVVAGTSIELSDEGIIEGPHKATWLDLKDSITGDAYCVAIFDGTVNTYPGTCAREEAPTISRQN